MCNARLHSNLIRSAHYGFSCGPIGSNHCKSRMTRVTSRWGNRDWCESADPGFPGFRKSCQLIKLCIWLTCQQLHQHLIHVENATNPKGPILPIVSAQSKLQYKDGLPTWACLEGKPQAHPQVLCGHTGQDAGLDHIIRRSRIPCCRFLPQGPQVSLL